MSPHNFHILFVFLDGVGLGPATADNPFATATLPSFARLAGDQLWTNEATPLREPAHVFVPLDATLGVDGLPQSGTGQATLFTGINGAQLAGRHYGPFPHSKTREALAAHNIFWRVQTLFPADAAPCAFANAYPDRFFDHVRARDRWTVTTRCCLDAGVRIRTARDLAVGNALAADITGAGWRRFDPDVAVISEADAARRLAALARRHRFTLFEYYLTDKAGHRQSAEFALQVLHALDRFFSALLEDFDSQEALLLITSDHGNLEDLSTKTHTYHPVPLVAYGRGAHHFAHARSLLDVVPAMVDAFAAIGQDDG